MCSTETVSAALAILSADRGGDVTPMRLEAWRVALEDVPDAAVMAAVKKFLVTDTGEFLPPVAKIRALAVPAPTVDTDTILAKIAKMGEYNPNVGWIYPRLTTVSERLGEVVAAAYAEAGAGRCFASADANGNTTTRDIARRAFATALADELRKSPDALRQLPTPAPALIPEVSAVATSLQLRGMPND